MTDDILDLVKRVAGPENTCDKDEKVQDKIMQFITKYTLSTTF